MMGSTVLNTLYEAYSSTLIHKHLSKIYAYEVLVTLKAMVLINSALTPTNISLLKCKIIFCYMYKILSLVMLEMINIKQVGTNIVIVLIFIYTYN